MSQASRPDAAAAGDTLPDPSSTSTLGWRAADAGADAAPLVLAPGTPVGRYLILDHLGAGGMGTVHSAWDRELQRKIALKLVRPERKAGEGAQQARSRFLREAQALAQISHPNVVAVHDVGPYGDEVYLAMEFVDGRDLRVYLEELPPLADPRRWQQVLEVFREIASGLAAVHAAGLVHRDVKPANLMVGKDGRARVMDFGLARRSAETAREESEGPAAEAGATPGSGADSPLEARLSHTGLRIGTPSYMSPEQFLCQPCDARSDVFAFCVALYEALYGQRPFGDGGEHAIRLLRGEIAAPPAASPVPDELFKVLERGLAVDREHRFGSMEELIAALLRVPQRRRQRRLLAAGAAALLLLVLLFAALRRYQDNLCGDGEALLAGVLGAPQKERIAAAFAATGRPFAAATGRALIVRLERWGASWAAQRRDACEATHRRGTQSEELLDRRVFCLDRRLDELHTTVGRLAAADAALVEKPAESLALLGDLEACADTVQLTSAGPLPPLARREALRGIQRRLIEATEIGSANRREEGLALARQAAQDAVALGYAPLVAEARMRLAFLLSSTSHLPEAKAEWLASIAAAIEGGDNAALAMSAYQLARHFSEDLGQPKEAEVFMRIAEGAAARLGQRPRLGSLLAHGRAQIAARGDDNVTALAELQTALSRIEGLPDTEQMRASYLNDLGIVFSNMGRYPEAADAFEKALALDREVYGEGHPMIASTTNNLGALHYSMENYAESLALHRQALELQRRAFPGASRDLALTLNNVATALRGVGQADESDRYQLESIAMLEQVLGPDHIELGTSLANLAYSYRQRGNYEKSIEVYQRALPIFEKHLGPDHFSLAGAHHGMGVTLALMGRPGEAVPHLRHSYEVFHRTPVDPRFRGGSSLQLAKALWEEGRHKDESRRLAKQALADYRADAGRFAKEIADTEAFIAAHP